MAVEEIFSQISTHMARGIIMHNDMSSLFAFLNLQGYQKCQEYHYCEQIKNYRHLHNFFTDNYNKMIYQLKSEKIQIIPESWYRYTRKQVDTGNKRSMIRNIFKQWVDWEQDTKILLQASYKQLYELGQVNAALQIGKFIQEVGQELKEAQQKLINLEAIDYDIISIIQEQQDLYKKYLKKIKHIYK